LTQKKECKEKVKAAFFPFPAEYFFLAAGCLRGDLPASRELPRLLNAACGEKNTGKNEADEKWLLCGGSL